MNIKKEENKFKFTLVIGGLAIVAVSYIFHFGLGDPEIKEEGGWLIVTDGKCFTSKKGTYIDQGCFSSKELAQKDLDSFLEYSNKRDKHESKDWKEVK